MRRIIDHAKEVKITAVIVSDLVVMNYYQKIGMKVYLSTQSNITIIEPVKFFAEYADVMTMATELTLKQVNDIVKAIKKLIYAIPKGS